MKLLFKLIKRGVQYFMSKIYNENTIAELHFVIVLIRNLTYSK